MSLLTIVSVMTPILLVIAAGWLFGRFQRLETVPLANLLLYLTSPCLVFASLVKAQIKWDQFFLMGGAALWVIGWLAVLMLLVHRYLPGQHRRTYFLPVIFMNTANVGLPLSLLAFGTAGLSLALIFHTVNALLIYSAGVVLILGRGSAAWGALKIPYAYVVTAAIVINQLGWIVPDAILNGISLLGDLTIPLMLLILGYQLGRTKVTEAYVPLVLSLLRFLGGLVLAAVFIQLFKVTGLPRAIILIMATLPAPVSAHLLAEKYQVGAKTAAATVFVSTILSLVTYPFLLAIL